MRSRSLLVLVLCLAPTVIRADVGKVIDVGTARPTTGETFENLWAVYQKALHRGETENAQSALREIRRLRVERNAVRLEEWALAWVSQGIAHLRDGDRTAAENDFRGAMGLDPHLPDAYFGLALADIKQGALGVFASVRDVVSGLGARLGTLRGRHALLTLLMPVTLIGFLLTVAVLAVVYVVRYGGLLRHDLEEAMGPGRSPMVALGLYVCLLLLPLVTFQGWGWVPLWWLTLLFLYLRPVEKGVASAALLMCLALGPLVKFVEERILISENPYFRASVLAVEGGPDARAIDDFEQAVVGNPDDRDLSYLLAMQYKKAGRYEEAANVYREILRGDPDDAIALNNLGNIEFATGEFQIAIARYKQAIDAGPPTDIVATLQYNRSLAHLQRFEYQPAQEARSEADRLAGGLIRSYDARWKYDKGDYAVVDLSLTPDQVWTKYGPGRMVREKNLAGHAAPGIGAMSFLPAALNRFSIFIVLFFLVVVTLARWRGLRSFTTRCLKCGTPFCRRCHLGTASEKLCTQCHHLFVVRDGVSAPARNEKLLQVQSEDTRRDRIFRVLSLAAPGAGHIYAQKTLVGVLFVFAWALTLALAVFAGRILPFTEASSLLAKPWGLIAASLILLALYVAANRAQPEFEVSALARRPSARRVARA